MTVEEQKTNLMSLAILFHFLCAQHVSDIYPSSGACDYSVELPQWSCVLGSMCVGVSVWLGWRGIRVQPATRIPRQPNNTNTHRTKNNTTNVVIQQNSRKFLMMDILMSETC